MRENEARQRIKDAGGEWNTFMDWMRGQTLGLYDDGSTDFYDYDVNRFIRYKCNPANEPIKDWD